MNNLLSYFGLVDAKVKASDKDLPVKCPTPFREQFQQFSEKLDKKDKTYPRLTFAAINQFQ